MTVPTVATFSAAALVAANTTFKTLIDAGGSAGSIKVRSAADVLLAQVPLTYPCGSVNATTGQLTLTPAGPDTSADNGGTAAYAEICSSAGTVHLALPTQAGTSAVSGYAVINTLTIVSGGTVDVAACTIG